MSSFARLTEVRALVLHGLAENATQHEEYIGQFHQMAKQVDVLYDQWLLHTGRRQARNISADRTDGAGIAATPDPPSLETNVQV